MAPPSCGTVKATVVVFVMLINTEASAQQGRHDGAFLYEACNALASAPEDLANVTSGQMFKAAWCGGYLTALHAELTKLHEYYKAFPNYGHWGDDDITKKYLASQLMLGADVCFPKDVRPKTLAMIISEYGRKNPNQLSSDMSLFAGWALQSAYPPKRCDR